jgi:ParE toxin of type II toxin-antitoxin system, parDE
VTAAERRHRLLDGAREDLRHAAQWYEERATGVGAALVLVIDQAISKVFEAPQRWPPLGASYQHYVLRRYPYSIVYRVREEVIHG